ENQVETGIPSAGTPHFKAISLLSNYDPVDANWHSIDLIAAGMPVGIKGVTIRYEFTSNGTHYLQFSDTSAGTIWGKGVVPVANGYASGEAHIKISSTGLLWWQAQAANISGFYLNTVDYDC
ncbi:MAG TPA: hypothetical protein VJ553_02425, partial [Candidatus Paceibacterota bacterium]|nr:hypothetical protein [Candidatus Paceibacterota bacterium]